MITESALFFHLFDLGGVGFPLWLLTNTLLLTLFPVILIIGGLIFLTLSYVSWRKYKGEFKRQKKTKSVD